MRMEQDYTLELIEKIRGRLKSVLNGTQRISHLNRISLNLALCDLKELENIIGNIDESYEWPAECDEGTFPDEA